MTTPRILRVAWLSVIACCAFAGCGGSSSSTPPIVSVTAAPVAAVATAASTKTPMPAATATPMPAATFAPSVAAVDDWVTFAHDNLRSGYEQQSTGITKANVSTLQLRWATTLPDQVYSSPLVTGGLVILAGQNSAYVFALSTTTGKIVWQTHLDGQLHSTGTISGGLLFIGSHDFTIDSANDYVAAPSHFYAIDITTGAVRWSIPVDGTIRGTPIAANGRVYYGVAGGDLPVCFQGGIFAVDAASGAPIWAWHVDTTPNEGGAIWAPLTFDGTTLYAGTGNTCGPAISTANGFVAVNAQTGTLDWSLVAQPDSVSDDDTGGGAVAFGGTLYFISKDGTFYAVDQASGRLKASKTLNPYNYQGGFATATSDGTTILIGDGTLSPLAGVTGSESKRFYSVRRKQSTAPVSSNLVALDTGLNVKWQIPVQNAVQSYAAINNGVVFAALDSSLTAIDITSGAKLWTYATAQIVDGGAAVVPSGVYVADSQGDVYAFGLPRAGSAAKTR